MNPKPDTDLNLGEQVWPIVNRALADKVFQGKDDVWDAIEQGFASVSQQQILDLYASMPHRLAAVLKAKGHYTKY